jgi:hypothetical protein
MGSVSDQDQLVWGLAALVACVARTLRKSDPTAETRLVQEIEAALAILRHHKEEKPRAEELLSLTKSLLTGFNLETGQGKPFLGD